VARLLVIAGTILAGLSTVGRTLPSQSQRQRVQQAAHICEVVVTALEYRLPDEAASDHITLPPTLRTVASVQLFKGDAADGCPLSHRFRGGPEGLGKMKLIPSWPGCDLVCANTPAAFPQLRRRVHLGRERLSPRAD
jgi:hypothetical protein